MGCMRHVTFPHDDMTCDTPTYPTVDHPAIRLHEDSRAQVFLRMPPIGRTRGAATETQDTLIEPILQEGMGKGSSKQKTHYYSGTSDM